VYFTYQLCVMTSDVEDQLDSSSLWNLLYFYCNQIYFVFLSNLSITSNFTSSSFSSLVNKEASALKLLNYFNHFLPYDEFQVELLKIFCAIITTNTLLLFIVWKIYGNQICQRFMKPATPKVIEELKKSVSQLKLPKQHTPRI